MRLNNMKRILLLILAAFLMIPNTSCNNTVQNTVNNTVQNIVNNTATNIKNSLLIYISPRYSSYSKRTDLFDAIDIYNKNHNIKIEKKEFPNYKLEDYKTKFALDLMSGQGIDIAIIENDDLSSPVKAISSGAFCDLNELIAKDESFDISLYNKKVFDSCVFNGKRYLIPLGYNLLSFLAQKSVFESKKIVIDKENWSWLKLGQIAENFMKQTTDTQQYFFATPYSEYLFYSIVLSREIPFIDYKNKQSGFDSPEFIETLQMFKNSIFPAITPPEILSSGTDWWQKSAIHDYGIIWGMGSVRSGYVAYDELPFNFYTMPSYNGEKSVFLEPSYLAGITSKCRYKREAYEFIKILLSDEIQKKNIYYPVNKNALMNSTTYWFENIDSGVADTSGNDADTTKQIIKSQFEIIEKQGVSQLIDYSVIKIIKTELPDYLSGKKTAEQTAKAINEKVSLYLNE